jgi:hypothetical protein
MQEETKKLIRTSVRSLLRNTDLSEYRIRKIVASEVDDPASWLYPGKDTEWCIRNYYGNLHNSQNVLVNFIDRLHARYGIHYWSHLNK